MSQKPTCPHCNRPMEVLEVSVEAGHEFTEWQCNNDDCAEYIDSQRKYRYKTTTSRRLSESERES